MTDIRNTNMVHALSLEEKEVFLLGTAHVSKESAIQAVELIQSVKPDAVCVELCQSRYQSIKQKDKWQETDIIKVIKEKKALLLLSNLILASFQKKIAKQFDINPGEEMIRAIEEGESIGAKIHLVDRDIRTTLLRTWMSLGFWAKIKLLFQILLSLFETPELKEEEIEKMKQEDILENFLAEIGKSLPSLRKILIDERDAYIAEKIRTCPGKKIVAVVGAGHVPGIKSKWGLEQDLNELESLPSKGKFSLFFKWFFPVAVTVLIIWGFFSGGVKVGTNMVASWILVTGLSAGLGALIAFGHPLTILSSILAAPLTTLHPLIAAGWISGLVEAFLRRPKVRDFENLSTDILSIKGFWKNKITKILLVVVFTNLGASLGVFVAVPMMLKIL